MLADVGNMAFGNTWSPSIPVGAFFRRSSLLLRAGKCPSWQEYCRRNLKPAGKLLSNLDGDYVETDGLLAVFGCKRHDHGRHGLGRTLHVPKVKHEL